MYFFPHKRLRCSKILSSRLARAFVDSVIILRRPCSGDISDRGTHLSHPYLEAGNMRYIYLQPYTGLSRSFRMTGMIAPVLHHHTVYGIHPSAMKRQLTNGVSTERTVLVNKAPGALEMYNTISVPQKTYTMVVIAIFILSSRGTDYMHYLLFILAPAARALPPGGEERRVRLPRRHHPTTLALQRGDMISFIHRATQGMHAKITFFS